MDEGQDPIVFCQYTEEIHVDEVAGVISASASALFVTGTVNVVVIAAFLGINRTYHMLMMVAAQHRARQIFYTALHFIFCFFSYVLVIFNGYIYLFSLVCVINTLYYIWLGHSLSANTMQPTPEEYQIPNRTEHYFTWENSYMLRQIKPNEGRDNYDALIRR